MENLPDIPEKGRYRFQYRGTECPNCRHPSNISDRYCPICSQANSTKKLSLKDYFDEFFASLISYDSKLLKTLGALLLRPGKITRDYIKGKRVSYTNPFRFLRSLAIIYFLMINFTENFSEWDRYGADKNSDFGESFNDITIGYDTERGAEAISAIDSVKKAIDYEAFESMGKQQDSLILSGPAKYFGNIGHDSSESKFSQKLGFFRALLRKDSITVINDATTQYDVPDTFSNKLAFNMSDGVLKLQARPGSFISALIS